MIRIAIVVALMPLAFLSTQALTGEERIDQALTITLTAEQTAQVSNATGREITVTLTREQHEVIKKRFPKLQSFKMKITLTTNGGKLAAPFIPGGAVLSAAVNGLDQMSQATASLSEKDDD